MLIVRGLISLTSFSAAPGRDIFAAERNVSDRVASLISMTALSAMELGLIDLAAAFDVVSVSLLSSLLSILGALTIRAGSGHAYFMQ
jgi:hypothetical protein